MAVNRRPWHRLPLRGSLLSLLFLFGISPRSWGQGYPLWEATGPSPDSQLGWSLAPAGDVDSDGVADLLVGGTGGVNSPGVVQVTSGSDGAVLLTVAGTTPGDGFGYAIASVGDLDGDAVPDFAAGAWTASPGGLPYAGRATAYSGAGGTVLLVLDGAAPEDNLGIAVVGPGDVNGDGVPDLVVGARGVDVSGMTNAGQVRVVSGSNGQLLYTIDGSTPGEAFGSPLASADDLDGDGVSDWIAGIPLLGSGGVARVFSGADGTTLFEFHGNGSYYYPTLPFGRFGAAVAGAGDVDADGVPDVLVGAPYATVGTLCLAGEAFVFSGATGMELFSFGGTFASDRLGASVAGVGDANADGFGDVLIGINQYFCYFCYCGSAYWPPMTGRATLYSGANGSPLVTIQGEEIHDRLGTATCGPGDLDGDGLPDLAVGAPRAGGVPGVSGLPGKVYTASLAGIPAGSFLFGSGCAGSGGIVPRIQTVGGPPTVGNDGFAVVLSKTLGGTTAVLIVGTTSQSWMGTSLPLDLGPWGLAGCSLLVAPEILVPKGTTGSGPGSGSVSFAAPIPPVAAPWLVGAFLHFQGYVIDPGPASLPGSMTRHLRVLVLP